MINALAIGIAAIFVVVALIFVGVHLYAYGWIWLDSSRLRRCLTRQGRVLSLGDARDKISQKEGMIIVDAPTLGWNVSRVWWSPVMDFVSRPPSWDGDCLCPPEDILNYRKFIDPSSGLAKLVVGFVFTQRIEKFLKHHFGTSDCGFVFSGGVLTQEHINSRGAEPGAAPSCGPVTPKGNSNVQDGPQSVT
jgi:hypothetical protein